MNEIQNLLKDFLDENENGYIHLLYPTRLDSIGGIIITEQTLYNDKKIKFMEHGIMIYQTLGYSLVTNKHLFLPYGECVFVFIENE